MGFDTGAFFGSMVPAGVNAYTGTVRERQRLESAERLQSRLEQEMAEEKRQSRLMMIALMKSLAGMSGINMETDPTFQALQPIFEPTPGEVRDAAGDVALPQFSGDYGQPDYGVRNAQRADFATPQPPSPPPINFERRLNTPDPWAGWRK